MKIVFSVTTLSAFLVLWVGASAYAQTSTLGARLERLKSSALKVASDALLEIRIRENATEAEVKAMLKMVLVETTAFSNEPNSSLPGLAVAALQTYTGPIPSELSAKANTLLVEWETTPPSEASPHASLVGTLRAISAFSDRAHTYQERILKILLKTILPSFDPGRDVFSDIPQDVRRELYRAFVWIDPARASQLMVEPLRSRDPVIVSNAISMLQSTWADPKILGPALQELAQSPTDSVRRDAIKAFFRIGSSNPQALRLAEQTLYDAVKNMNGDMIATSLNYLLDTDQIPPKGLKPLIIDLAMTPGQYLAPYLVSRFSPFAAEDIDTAIRLGLERHTANNAVALIDVSNTDISNLPSIKGLEQTLRHADQTELRRLLTEMPFLIARASNLKPFLAELNSDDRTIRTLANLILGIAGEFNTPQLETTRRLLNEGTEHLYLAMYVIQQGKARARELIPDLERFIQSTKDYYYRELAQGTLERLTLDGGFDVGPLKLDGQTDTTVCGALRRLFNRQDWLTEMPEDLNNSGAVEESGKWVATRALIDIFLKKYVELKFPDHGISIDKTFPDQAHLRSTLSQLLRNSASLWYPLNTSGEPYALMYRYERAQQFGLDTQILGTLESNLKLQFAAHVGKAPDNNSKYSAFTYSVTALALGDATPAEAKQTFIRWVSSQPPLKISYASNGSFFWGSELGSAVRNVTVHLARLRYEPTAASASVLVRALKNWVTHSGVLRKRSQTNLGHDRSLDGVAHFFFYPGLPYVTTALKVLERSPNLLSAIEKQDVDQIRTYLRTKLPLLVDGLGRLDSTPARPTTMAYAYPLYGLALLNLIQKNDACYTNQVDNDFGIIRW